MCQSRNRSQQRRIRAQGLTMIKISKTHNHQGSLLGRRPLRENQDHQRQLQAGRRVILANETSLTRTPWTP